MTELGFLVDLLLNHKLPKATRDFVAARLKGIDEAMSANIVQASAHNILRTQSPAISNQAPSMQRIMERNPDLVPAAPEPVAVIAQTQAAVAAMNSRSQAIAESMAGKVDKVTGRPRKF